MNYGKKDSDVKSARYYARFILKIMYDKDNRTELLREIRDEVWHFKESPLYEERVQNRMYPVIGEGSHNAKIMLIGEAPGKTEAQTGRPFAGSAGRVLDELLASVGIVRKEVYITNIVKDRPTGNRDPSPEEIALYAPFLNRQIEIIKPAIIVMLGRYAMRYIMERFGLPDAIAPISKIHGAVYDGRASYGNIKVIPMYHPATVLYKPELKEELMDDFKILKKLLE